MTPQEIAQLAIDTANNAISAQEADRAALEASKIATEAAQAIPDNTAQDFPLGSPFDTVPKLTENIGSISEVFQSNNVDERIANSDIFDIYKTASKQDSIGAFQWEVMRRQWLWQDAKFDTVNWRTYAYFPDGTAISDDGEAGYSSDLLPTFEKEWENKNYTFDVLWNPLKNFWATLQTAWNVDAVKPYTDAIIWGVTKLGDFFNNVWKDIVNEASDLYNGVSKSDKQIYENVYGSDIWKAKLADFTANNPWQFAPLELLQEANGKFQTTLQLAIGKKQEKENIIKQANTQWLKLDDQRVIDWLAFVDKQYENYAKSNWEISSYVPAAEFAIAQRVAAKVEQEQANKDPLQKFIEASGRDTTSNLIKAKDNYLNNLKYTPKNIENKVEYLQSVNNAWIAVAMEYEDETKHTVSNIPKDLQKGYLDVMDAAWEKSIEFMTLKTAIAKDIEAEYWRSWKPIKIVDLERLSQDIAVKQFLQSKWAPVWERKDNQILLQRLLGDDVRAWWVSNGLIDKDAGKWLSALEVSNLIRQNQKIIQWGKEWWIVWVLKADGAIVGSLNQEYLRYWEWLDAIGLWGSNANELWLTLDLTRNSAYDSKLSNFGKSEDYIKTNANTYADGLLDSAATLWLLAVAPWAIMKAGSVAADIIWASRLWRWIVSATELIPYADKLWKVISSVTSEATTLWRLVNKASGFTKNVVGELVEDTMQNMIIQAAIWGKGIDYNTSDAKLDLFFWMFWWLVSWWVRVAWITNDLRKIEKTGDWYKLIEDRARWRWFTIDSISDKAKVIDLYNTLWRSLSWTPEAELAIALERSKQASSLKWMLLWTTSVDDYTAAVIKAWAKNFQVDENLLKNLSELSKWKSDYTKVANETSFQSGPWQYLVSLPWQRAEFSIKNDSLWFNTVGSTRQIITKWEYGRLTPLDKSLYNKLPDEGYVKKNPDFNYLDEALPKSELWAKIAAEEAIYSWKVVAPEVVDSLLTAYNWEPLLVGMYLRSATYPQVEFITKLSDDMIASKKASETTDWFLWLVRYNKAKNVLEAELMRFAMQDPIYGKAVIAKLKDFNSVIDNPDAKLLYDLWNLNRNDFEVLLSQGYSQADIDAVRQSAIRKGIEQNKKAEFFNAVLYKSKTKTRIWDFFKLNPSQMVRKLRNEVKDWFEKGKELENRHDYLKRVFKNSNDDENIAQMLEESNIDDNTFTNVMLYKYMNGWYINFEVAQSMIKDGTISNLIDWWDFWNNLERHWWDLKKYLEDSFPKDEWDRLLELLNARPAGWDLNDAVAALRGKKKSGRAKKGINDWIFDQVFKSYADIIWGSTEYNKIKQKVLADFYKEWMTNAQLQSNIIARRNDIIPELFQEVKKSWTNIDDLVVWFMKPNATISDGAIFIKIKQANAVDNLTEYAYKSNEIAMNTNVVVKEFDNIEDAWKFIEENPDVQKIVNQWNVPDEWKDVIKPKNWYRFESNWGKLAMQANGVAQLNTFIRKTYNVEIAANRAPEFADAVRKLRKAEIEGDLTRLENADIKVVTDITSTTVRQDKDGFIISNRDEIATLIKKDTWYDVTIKQKDFPLIKDYIFNSDYWALQTLLKNKKIITNDLPYTRSELYQRMLIASPLKKNRGNSELFDFIIDNEQALARGTELDGVLWKSQKARKILEDNTMYNGKITQSWKEYINSMLSVISNKSREWLFPIWLWAQNSFLIERLLKITPNINQLAKMTVDGWVVSVIEKARIATNELLNEYIKKAESLLKGKATSQQLSNLHSEYANKIKSYQNYYYDMLWWPDVYNEFKPVRIMNADDLKAYNTPIASSSSYADQFKWLNKEFWSKLSLYATSKSESNKFSELLKYGKSSIIENGKYVKVEIDDVIEDMLRNFENDNLVDTIKSYWLDKLPLEEKQKLLAYLYIQPNIDKFIKLKEDPVKLILGKYYNDLVLKKVYLWTGIVYLPNSIFKKLENESEDIVRDAAKHYQNLLSWKPLEPNELFDWLFADIATIFNKEVWDELFTYRDIVSGNKKTNKYINSKVDAVKKEIEKTIEINKQISTLLWWYEVNFKGVDVSEIEKHKWWFNIKNELNPPKSIQDNIDLEKAKYAAQDDMNKFIKNSTC